MKKGIAPKSKYNANKTWISVNGAILDEYEQGATVFDSELEARYYRDVLLPQIEAGTITIQFQPTFVIIDRFEKNGVKYQPTKYTPDFLVVDHVTGKVHAVEVKGFVTQAYALRKRVFDDRHRDIPLLVMKYVKKYGGWIEALDYKKQKNSERKAR